jgi:hypothetical protein
MKYLIINPIGLLNANQRAELLSRELYCLTLPRKYQDESQHINNVFPVIKTLNNIYLQVFLDYEIPIHPEADIEGYINLYQGEDMDEVRELLNTSDLVIFSQIYSDGIFVDEINFND